jgi:hypothetical protein
MKYWILVLAFIGCFNCNAQSILDLMEIHDAQIEKKKELLSELGYYFGGTMNESNVSVYTFFKEGGSDFGEPDFVSIFQGSVNCVGLGFIEGQEAEFFNRIKKEALLTGYKMALRDGKDEVYRDESGSFEDITLIKGGDTMIIYGDARAFR